MTFSELWRSSDNSVSPSESMYNSVNYNSSNIETVTISNNLDENVIDENVIDLGEDENYVTYEIVEHIDYTEHLTNINTNLEITNGVLSSIFVVVLLYVSIYSFNFVLSKFKIKKESDS